MLRDIVDDIKNTWFLDTIERLSMPEIILIAALGRNKENGQHNVIGKNGTLPWDFREYKEDMKRFKEATTDNVVVMGRKTFESIGSCPLPKRKNLIITSNNTLTNPKPERHMSLHPSAESALLYFKENGFKQKLFVIGGQTIYEQFMPIATKMMLTYLDTDADGDVFFPDCEVSPAMEQVFQQDQYKSWSIEKEETVGPMHFVNYKRPHVYL